MAFFLQVIGWQRCHLASEKAPTYNDSQQIDSRDIPRAGKQRCQNQIPQTSDTVSVPTRTSQSEAGSLSTRQVTGRIGCVVAELTLRLDPVPIKSY